MLKALLTNYGSKISGYYICDPVNSPETCNMATTLAGIHQAMVVNPDNLTVMSAYKIPLLSDLRSTIWTGNNASLVDNKTYQHINNPSGESETTGWRTSTTTGQTLTATTYLNATALRWTSAANQKDTWAYFEPTVTLGAPYCYSVQVAGTGTVFLDAWDGNNDNFSSPVTLTSAYKTLQLCIPLPLSDDSHLPRLEVRSHPSSSAITVYFINAAVIENSVSVPGASGNYSGYIDDIGQTAGTKVFLFT